MSKSNFKLKEKNNQCSSMENNKPDFHSIGRVVEKN